MNSVNIIADSEGDFDAVMRLISMMPEADHTVMVGDINDRGWKTPELIQWAIDNQDKVTVLNSNHGYMFVEFYDHIMRTIVRSDGTAHKSPYRELDFIRNGGLTTLYSYARYAGDMDVLSNIGKTILSIPKKHIEFLRTRPLFFTEIQGLVVSHAPLTHQYPNDSVFNSIWNREMPRVIEGIVQVFGHNSQWGFTEFTHYINGKTYAICLDDSRKNKVLMGLHWPSKKDFSTHWSRDEELSDYNQARMS